MTCGSEDAWMQVWCHLLEVALAVEELGDLLVAHRNPILPPSHHEFLNLIKAASAQVGTLDQEVGRFI